MQVIALAMVLAVIQAAPPAPRKIPINSANGRDAVKNDRADQKQPANLTSALEEKVQATTDQNPSRKPADTNTSKSVVVPEPAAVPILRKDWWDKAYVIFTGALVLVGFSGAYLAWRTLRAIERQGVSMRRQTTLLRKSVESGRKGAKAALLNAQAVIDSERPWVVPIITIKHFPRIAFIGGEERPREPIDFGVTLKFKNYGRTPARILSVRDIPLTIKHDEQLPQIPEYAAEPSSTFQGERMLVPEDEPWECDGIAAVASILTRQQFIDVDNGAQLFIYLGRIQYTDVLRPELIHESRFCHFYRPKIGEMIMEGPSEYNKYT